jgi:transcriptional regulator GlxA family with amidase domain
MSIDQRVVLVLLDGFQLLDMAGPADVFRTVSRVLGPSAPAYSLRLAALRPGPVRAACGTTVLADTGLDTVGSEVDTLLVVGGVHMIDDVDSAAVEAVRQIAGNARRVASVCAGALVLAEAGLLDGREATTHWFAAPTLAARYPKVVVTSDRMYVRDGPVWTSAGASAGMDLALALIAEDHGPQLAREVARWLVLYLHRPGSQSQFAAPLTQSRPRGGRFDELCTWITRNPDQNLSLPLLAERAHMSVRHFCRTFAAEVGMPPGRFVEHARLDAARRLLEITDHTLDHVARATGLGGPQTLHRVFHRLLGVSPGDYRRHFRAGFQATRLEADMPL